MKAKDLRNSILQLAVQGKLVPQDPNDEPAAVLLDRIRAERAKLIKEKKIKAPKGGESVIYRASDGRHYEKRGKGESHPVEVPFEIPESWEWVRLGCVAEVQLGKMLDKQKNQGSPKPYLGNINVQWDRFDLGEVKTMLFKDEELDKFRVYPGDLMVCEGGVPGRCAIWKSDEEMYYQKAIHRIRCTPGVLTAGYCRLVLQYIVNSHQLDNEFTGTTIKHLPARVLEQWIIPLPPMPEQVRMVRAFECIEPLVDAYGCLEDSCERLDAELPERLRKSILQEAVQGKLVPQDPTDEPASALLERIRAERSALVKAGKLKAPKGGESVIFLGSDGGYYEKRGKSEPQPIEVPFDIPDGWGWARVSSVFNLVRGSGIKRTEVIETGEPCVRYGELYTTYRSEITLVASHTSSTVYDKAQKLLDGEVVATLTGENDIDIGRAVVNNTGETIAFGGDLLALKGNYLDGNFAMLSLNAPYMGSQRTVAASGNIIVHLSADKIGNFLMAVPPLDEQKRIVGRCKELLAAVG